LASTNTAETAPTPRPQNRQEQDEEPLKVGFSNKSLSQFRDEDPQTRFNSHPENREPHHRLGMVQHYAPDL
jgi:hypothetical protein